MKSFKKSCFILPIKLSNKHSILYHSLTGSILLVDKEVGELLEKEDFEKIPSEYLDVLKEQNFIVPHDLDEIALYEFLFNSIKFTSSTESFVILTTYDCNFKCVYCYEWRNNVISSIYMNSETASNVIKYIEEKIQKRASKVSIALYGGEPLLNINIGFTILENVSKYCEKIGTELETGIITNGSLLTKDIAEKICDYNVKSIQVTIDGTKEIHDKRRPFKNGKGSFSIIIENLKDVIDIFPPNTITIRFNMDKMNFHNLPKFLDYLESIGFKSKIKFWIGVPQGVSPYCNIYQYAGKELYKRVFEAWKIVIERGFLFHYEPGVNVCSAITNTSRIIDPLGKIYKCWGLVGMDQFSVGDVFEGENSLAYVKFVGRNPLHFSRCRKCNILPYCNGGCLYESYFKIGDPFKIACGTVFGRETLKTIIKLYVMDRYKDILKKKGIKME